MEVAIAVLAVLVAGLSVWAWRLNGRTDEPTVDAEAAEQAAGENVRLSGEVSDLRVQLGRAEASLDERDKQLEEAKEKRAEVEKALAEQTNARADAEKETAALRSEARTRDEELARARQEQETLVKGMASDVLKATREELREQAKADQEQQRKLAAKELELRQAAVKEMVKPIGESLKSLDKSMREMETVRQTAYTGLTDRVDRLNSETGNLREILRSSQLRGTWGEKSLENILQLAGLREGNDYESQVSAGSGAERADFAIRIPGGRRIVVDAKTPFEAYRRALETEDPDEQKTQLDEHAMSIERTATELAKRRYPDHIDGALNFVVMWIPSDSIVEAAVRVRPSLVEDVFTRDRVLIATPVTMLALVTGVAAALEQERFNESALEIREHAQTIYDGLRRHADAYTKLGRNLATAVNGYNEGLRSMQGNLLSGATKIRELGGAPSGDVISEPEPLDAATREFTRPALRQPNTES